MVVKNHSISINRSNNILLKKGTLHLDIIENDINKNNIINNFESFEFNLYIYLILSFEKEKFKNYLIENELNELDYIYYKEIDSRKWYKIIWSFFKLNCDFLSTFFIFNSYNFLKEYRI